jgi:hypothetical protein
VPTDALSSRYSGISPMPPEEVPYFLAGKSRRVGMSDDSSKRSRHPYRRSQPQHSGRERGDEERLEHLIIEGITSDDLESGPAAALFVLIGADPRIDWLPTCGRGHLAQG